MIQEFLGGAGLIGGERKIPISGNILEGTSSPCLSPSPSSSTITNTTAVTVAASATNNSTSSTSENLRCPRCDSSNTKFCYYNNYNLTQPRHFCKTCRRYWTKGGALRNVPIGGGCRKNKSTSVSAVVGKSSSTNKLKSVVSEVGRSAFGNGFAHEFSSSPNLWSPPENSHILALLRGTHYPSPSALSNTLNFKEEGSMSMLGTNIMTEVAMANGAVNARTLGLEPLSQGPSLGLCSPFWKTSQKQVQNHQQNGSTVCEAQNSGLQELYQRLRSSTSSNYYMDNSSVILSNVASSSTSASNILESAPVAGGELGFWNPAFSWSDLPTTNGAYP